MKSREIKATDLAALTESLAASTSAMVVSFSGLTVQKDQEFRRQLREAGAKYEVVKNTLARIAVKGTQFEQTAEHFKGVTAIAWTDNDPVVLSKAISKFMKENADIYTFKTGVVDGKLVDLAQLTTIANLPSKEELISKLLFVLNSQAQRLVTVINAVPRNLAVVVKQIGDAKPGDAAAEPVAEAKTEEPAPAPSSEGSTSVEAEVSAEAPVAEETPAVEAASEEPSEAEAAAAPTEEAPAAEAEAASEDATQAEESTGEVVEETAPEADAEEKAE